MHRSLGMWVVIGMAVALLMADGGEALAADEGEPTNAELLKELREMKQRIQILEQQVQQARQGVPPPAQAPGGPGAMPPAPPPGTARTSPPTPPPEGAAGATPAAPTVVAQPSEDRPPWPPAPGRAWFSWQHHRAAARRFHEDSGWTRRARENLRSGEFETRPALRNGR